MKTEKLNDMLKVIDHKVTMDLEWKWMSPDTTEAFEWLIDEVEEAIIEYKNKKTVYLEDELWDVVWSIFRVIELIDREWLIKKERIFDRAIKKFSERTYGLEEWKAWDDIKRVQKKELLDEQNKLENNN